MVKALFILRKRIRREIRASFRQFIAVMLIAFLAVTLFTGLTANYKKLEYRVQYLYEAGNMADLWVVSMMLEAEDYEAVSAIEGITACEKRLFMPASSGGKSINVLVTDGLAKISCPVAENYGGGGYIDRNFARQTKLNFNKDMQVSFNAKSMLSQMENIEQMITFLDIFVKEGEKNLLLEEQMTFSVEVVSEMLHPETITTGSFGSGALYLTYEDLYFSVGRTLSKSYTPKAVDFLMTALREQNLYNQLVIKAEESEGLAVKSGIESYFASKEKNNLLMVYSRENFPGNTIIENDIKQATMLTYVFPVIFFLVSVLIIMTTISQLILKERKEIGTLKALGFSQGTILRHYMLYGITICLIGSVLGAVVGPAFIPSVMDVKNEILYQLPEITMPLFYPEYFLSVLLLVGLSALVGYLVCKSDVKLKPAESMRPKIPKNTRVTRFEKTAAFQKLPIPLKMSYRNIVRKKSRAAMVVIGVAGCTALLVCGFGVSDTIQNSINKEIYEIFPAEINVTLVDGLSSAKSQIESVSGIISAEEYIKMDAKIQFNDVRDTYLYLMEEDSCFVGFPLSNSGCVISDKLSRYTGAVVGDELIIVCGNVRLTKTVEGIYESGFTQGVFLTKEQGMELPQIPTGVFAFVKEGFDMDEEAEKIRDFSFVSKVYSTNDFLVLAGEVNSTIEVITNTLKVFALLLAVVVLYNLALLNFKERQRDIATLKVLGFFDIEIGSTLIVEIMLLTFFGTVVGLFLGMPILKLILSINETEILSFLYHIHPLSYLYSAAITLLTAFFINYFLSKLVKKVKMIESLKSVE